MGKNWSLGRHWKQNPSFRAGAKFTLIVAILTILATILIPRIQYWLEPTKEIEIWVNQIAVAEDVILTKDELWTIAPALLQICGKETIFLKQRTKNPESLRGKSSPYLLSIPVNDCPKCYYYDIVIRNHGKEFSEDFTFFVSLDNDDFQITGIDKRILISPPMGMPGTAGFYITIPSLKQEEELLFSIQAQNSINIDFENEDNKEKFIIIEREIEMINKQDLIEKFYDSLDITPTQPVGDNNVHLYRFDIFNWEFEEMNITPFYMDIPEEYCEEAPLSQSKLPGI